MEVGRGGKWWAVSVSAGLGQISLYLCLFGRSQRLHYGICCVCVWRRKSEKLRSRRDGRGDGRPLCFVISCFGWLGDFGRVDRVSFINAFVCI